MNKKTILAVIALLFIVGAGAYVYVTRPTKAPSQPAQANEEVQNPNGETPTSSATGTKTYRVVAEASSAEFNINEVLRGSPFTVVGKTGLVEGEVTVDRTDLSSTQLGVVRVNARGLATDSPQRNNAIKRFILKSENDANEFIVFESNAMSGMPTSTEIGADFPFQVQGDLTIAGTTKPATFVGTARFTSETELQGQATSTINYKDFGLTIPEVPFVASVEDEVVLKMSFVARSN